MYVFYTHDARIYTLKQRGYNVRHDSSDRYSRILVDHTLVGVNMLTLLPLLHPRFGRKASTNRKRHKENRKKKEAFS